MCEHRVQRGGFQGGNQEICARSDEQLPCTKCAQKRTLKWRLEMVALITSANIIPPQTPHTHGRKKKKLRNHGYNDRCGCTWRYHLWTPPDTLPPRRENWIFATKIKLPTAACSYRCMHAICKLAEKRTASSSVHKG